MAIKQMSKTILISVFLKCCQFQTILNQVAIFAKPDLSDLVYYSYMMVEKLI